MRLSPLDPLMFAFRNVTAYAHFIAGRYDEALSWEQKVLRGRPNFPAALRVAAASDALAGRLEKAQKTMAHLRELDPELRVSNLKDYSPLLRPEDLARFEEGLRRAGLPD
jgi:tetratricopeptide (TPR) repeat protein